MILRTGTVERTGKTADALYLITWFQILDVDIKNPGSDIQCCLDSYSIKEHIYYPMWKQKNLGHFYCTVLIS